MNPDGLSPQAPQNRDPERIEEKKSTSPLSLTPEQAKREARKLHQLRNDLKTREAVQDTTMRSSPLGRDD